MRDEVDVAVVGGGAAGIAAARRVLREPGASVLLIEAKDRLGGRAHTAALPGTGAPMDLGCAWLHSALTNAWRGVAEATPGFTVDRRPAPWDDPDRDLGLSPDESADYRRTLDAFHARVEAAGRSGGDGALSDLLPAGSRWRGLLDAVSTFVSGAELDRVSVRDSADYRPGEGGDWRVVEGYGALVAHHGRDVPAALGTAVRRIDHSGAGRVRVETDRGTVLASAVVVTASTGVLAREAIRFHPALPEKHAAAAALPLGLADKLYLRTTEPGLFPVEGYAFGSPERARTAVHHIRPFGRPLVECFYGGELAQDLEREGEAAAFAFCRAEIAAHLGSRAASALEPVHMTAWGREAHVFGSYAYAVPGGAGARARLGAPVDGRLFFAGEAVHPSRFTTAHGAFESGEAAAAAALAALRGAPQPAARSAALTS